MQPQSLSPMHRPGKSCHAGPWPTCMSGCATPTQLSASSHLHNFCTAWDTPGITAWLQHALWHVSLPSPEPADKHRLCPVPFSTCTRQRAQKCSPLGLQYPHHGGNFPGQHLPVPACRYKGQPLLLVFDPTKHPHLHISISRDTAPVMLHPETG